MALNKLSVNLNVESVCTPVLRFKNEINTTNNASVASINNHML